MRGAEGSEVKLLLQRGGEGELIEVCLERVLQGIIDPSGLLYMYTGYYFICIQEYH
jgi:hypothetical protein